MTSRRRFLGASLAVVTAGCSTKASSNQTETPEPIEYKESLSAPFDSIEVSWMDGGSMRWVQVNVQPNESQRRVVLSGPNGSNKIKPLPPTTDSVLFTWEKQCGLSTCRGGSFDVYDLALVNGNTTQVKLRLNDYQIEVVE